MDLYTRVPTTGRTSRLLKNKGLLVGIAGGIAAITWLALGRSEHRDRRYADRSEERRNPWHFFLAGTYPRRRAIDRSPNRPLFERRQSAYDSY
ncbi:hypothetical protein [Noviherbaspirillum saxi]|uniref:Uncharacterized protein n=1 Tax=Noviherbaspirillum saxi TaxID=2320863 RepID=A0A3A3FPH3_9BURK|nr:hypothetical protein [Noviherbaspirillum saxi]RJF95352.1 hypothetical protein D3871_18150 [Noviherbaspirillum saxi]